MIVRALAPFGWLFGAVSYWLLVRKTPKYLGVKVISIGNIVVGGTGKTPLTAYLANRYDRAAIVLRGYKRALSGVVIVGDQSATEVGDEAKLYRELAPNALVIVSRDRTAGVLKAKELGAQIVFLDDGFRHRLIAKFDIVIKPFPAPQNNRCLPAGCFRLPPRAYALADFVAEPEHDFVRTVSIENPSETMVLLTAIARAERLEPFLPSVAARYIFPDHHIFTRDEVSAITAKHSGATLLVTQKDAVKLRDFDVKLSILKLELTVSDRLNNAAAEYIKR
ncbi:tetraacyldisaccharide 4'-kinase [Campylobacterota bacterium]|nr:tetraacyldisaccharide 4'-kinase [Campylobacterota bacterium]